MSAALMNHNNAVFFMVLLTGIFSRADFMEMKPIMTRKLRRRPNDPMPMPEKRRKPSPDILAYYSYSSCSLCVWMCVHLIYKSFENISTFVVFEIVAHM